jgi:hypothetical protein
MIQLHTVGVLSRLAAPVAWLPPEPVSTPPSLPQAPPPVVVVDPFESSEKQVPSRVARAAIIAAMERRRLVHDLFLGYLRQAKRSCLPIVRLMDPADRDRVAQGDLLADLWATVSWPNGSKDTAAKRFFTNRL